MSCPPPGAAPASLWVPRIRGRIWVDICRAALSLVSSITILRGVEVEVLVLVLVLVCMGGEGGKLQ
jgi:hypothetical protein